MAKYWLLNTINVGAVRLPAGKEIDDTNFDIATLASIGAVLWPYADPYVTVAAGLAAAGTRAGQGDQTATMNAGAIASLQAGAGGITGGDVSVLGGIAKVVGLYGKAFDPVTLTNPPPGGVVTWDGGAEQYIVAVPGSVPTVGITGWSVTPTVVEVGAMFNPSGTASYAGTPDSATVTRTGFAPQALSAPYESWDYGTPIAIGTVLGTETFTLTVTFGATPYSRAASVVAGARIYYGVSTDPGTYDEAFVLGLDGSNVQTGGGFTAQGTTAVGTYLWMFVPFALNASPTWYVWPQGQSPQFPGSVLSVGTLIVTNGFGVPVAGALYRTFNDDQGPINMRAS